MSKRKQRPNKFIKNNLEEYQKFQDKYKQLEKDRLSSISNNEQTYYSKELIRKELKRKLKNIRNKERKKEKLRVLKQKGSNSEYIIAKYLKNKYIDFIQEAQFTDLINPKTGEHLRFDFYIPERNICIEYDGKQHFSYVPEIHGDCPKKAAKMIKSQKYRDSLKDQYCKERAIRLIRLNYKDYYKLEKSLDKLL